MSSVGVDVHRTDRPVSSVMVVIRTADCDVMKVYCGENFRRFDYETAQAGEELSIRRCDENEICLLTRSTTAYSLLMLRG